MIPTTQRLRSAVAAGLTLLLLSAGDLAAQVEPPVFEIALDPSAVMTLPVGTLESIRGSVPCSDDFGATASVNPAIGLRLALPLDTLEATVAGSRLRAIGLSAGYDLLDSRFVSSPATPLDAYDPVNGREAVVMSEHEALFRISALRLALDGELVLGGGLLLRPTLSASFPMSAESRESERILSPENATFLDATQERTITEGTGALEGTGMRLGAGVALAYRSPLGNRLYFEPNIGIDYGITTMEPSWSPLLFRGGIAIGLTLRRSTPPVVPPVVVETPPVVEEIPFTATLTMRPLADPLPVEFRRQIVARYIPLLPVIFFDRDAGTLPSRYSSVATEQSVTLPPDAEAAHRVTLDIFGRRLQDRQRARVTLTGTTSADETDRPALARARAEAVASYLASRWNIDRSRITVRSRVDPLHPSNPAYVEGLEENRRVELEFSDEEIYSPVALRSVEPTAEPAAIPFALGAASRLTIERWETGVEADGGLLEGFSGDGSPPDRIVWRLDPTDRERVLDAGRVTYRLAVFDSAGRSVRYGPEPLPVRRDTTVSVTTSAERPANRADFLLVTFDFDRAQLTARGRRELQEILARIGPRSTVSVIGYTDPLGDEARNRTLATERARNVASSIPSGVAVEVRGAAPGEAPYSAGSPEGRFLSRTVRVLIENPR